MEVLQLVLALLAQDTAKLAAAGVEVLNTCLATIVAAVDCQGRDHC